MISLPNIFALDKGRKGGFKGLFGRSPNLVFACWVAGSEKVWRRDVVRRSR